MRYPQSSSRMTILALAHQTAGRIVELGFLLVAAAGALVMLGSVGIVPPRSANAAGGLALAVGGLVLIAAFHWDHF
jgi:hypothetical protein